MNPKRAVAWLVVLALFAAGFGFFVGVDDANAANRTCTSSESNVLNSLEGQLKSATTAAGSVNREAATALTNLSRSQKDLDTEQKRLADQRARCRS